MYIHHLFTFPSWYIEGISYPQLTLFARAFCKPTKICVCIFAFLTGYSYYFCKSKSLKYTLKKCTDVWISYAFSFLLLLIPALLFHTCKYSLTKFILELFALERPTMVFCWYVVFYYTTMLALPVYSALSEKSAVACFLASLIIPLYLSGAAESIISEDFKIYSQIFANMSWFPCVSCGYLFAQKRLFFQFSILLSSKRKIRNIGISLLLMSFAAGARIFTENYDFACAALFIYGSVELYHAIDFKRLFIPLEIIGKYSLLLWFIHCAFFNNYKSFTQPILYFSQNPVSVLLFGLILCLSIAVIISIPISYLIKTKNKLLKLEDRPL